MLRPLAIVAALILVVGLWAESAEARNRRNTNYYGTPRHAGARIYSGAYQAQRPNNVRTFTLPGIQGGGYYAPYGRYGYGRGYYPVYQQPIILYPPRVTYGFGGF